MAIAPADSASGEEAGKVGKKSGSGSLPLINPSFQLLHAPQ